MNLSNTTDKSGIIQRCETLSRLGDAGISGDAVLLKQFTSYINQAYYEIWMAQLSVDKQWKRDDYNYADLPDAAITGVTSQADYTLPVAVTSANVATFLRLNSVYYEDNGVRITLRQMDADEQETTIDNVPYAYRCNGKSLTFNCPLSAEFVTKYPTFHVEFQRVPEAFPSSGSDIKVPGFMETYHDLIPLKASALYMLPVDANISQLYDRQFYARLELFKRDIAQMDDNNNRAFESEVIQYR